MYIRSMEMHSCPVLEKQARTAISAAFFTSASASTSIAFLPPSSIEHPIRCRPHCSREVPADSRGAREHEVVGILDDRRPELAPGPTTTCTSPSGRPASRSRRTAHSAVSGVWESGLSTIPLPASRAGIASDTARVSG